MLRAMERYLAILPHSWPIRFQRVEDHLIVFCIREKSGFLLHQEGNLCISDDYCFDGIEENSTVAIGTVGGSPYKLIDRERFEKG